MEDTLPAERRALFNDYLYRANKAAFIAHPAVSAILAEEQVEERYTRKNAMRCN